MTQNRLHVEDRAGWRAWLNAHHDREQEVWLVYGKGSETVISYGESVEEALCFGWIDGLIRSMDDATYLRRFTPRRTGSRWSSSNRRRVDRLLNAGLMEAPGMAVIEAAKADGSWDELPDAERTWGMPEELADALALDEAARRRFEDSSPSHRRQFTMWVASAKLAETRVRRAARAVDMLREGTRPT